MFLVPCASFTSTIRVWKLLFQALSLCEFVYNFRTYLPTSFMVQSPSSVANWFAANQEIPHISRNPKIHYRTHKRPPAVSILGQPSPVHILTFHLLEIHPNIIHPSMSRSPLSLFSSLNVRDQVSHPYKTCIISLYLLISDSSVYANSI